MSRKTAEFINDGVIYSNGEEVSKYRSGDKVTFYQEISEDLVTVLINEGESQGLLVTIEKELLK